ncbi:hypothetical protein F443_17712 [Phytophthora nicotianae P1569]|uniref:Uncharacterized protein n=1 Tax=Phytophthora nicotianae P1569 TaxID=1317065 RepID=V9EC84_PHYNI|nr:hypothetical protein F443_22393 [Phytophthora nicotianae P1569]ETI36108.1 hypothetical protein F443_17712 [Phytophthora nicotianae P1569]
MRSVLKICMYKITHTECDNDNCYFYIDVCSDKTTSTHATHASPTPHAPVEDGSEINNLADIARQGSTDQALGHLPRQEHEYLAMPVERNLL